MPGIYLYTGNRLEILAEKLTDLLSTEPLPPLEKETILIQSRGMERWLAQTTAGRRNIWANCYCPFPNTFIRNIYKRILPGLSESSPYDKKVITWHLMDLIPELLGEMHFEKVRRYLDSDDDRKLYQLAHEIADLFDQYTIFRPAMVLEWESDRSACPADHKWQSVLWQRLVERLQADKGELHRARLLEYFEKKIHAPFLDSSLLPARISVFGISSLPPYHLKVLTGLAHYVDLHIFIMNPCLEFWADIIADRDIVKVSRDTITSEELLHLDHGNPLLSSMGHQGRDFLAMVQELECKEEEYFLDPGGETLLTSIQQEILFLRRNPVSTLNASLPRKKIKSSDRSVVFQSCHSPMREVEVLHDQLLDLFEQGAGSDRIAPRDILVMAPDINDYAPLIRAVFDAESSQKMKLPYRIADQAITRSSRFIDAFRTILALAKGRLTSIDVLGILKSEPVKNRFSFSEHEFSILERWINRTGICWGIDDIHKKNINLPGFMENTWRAGLDQLLLGYAMEGNNKILFKNILPYDPMEGNNTDILGRFAEYIEALFELPEKLLRKHTLSEWSEIFLQVKETFLLADESSESDNRLLYQVILELQELQVKIPFLTPVSLDVIQSYLFDSLEQRYSAMTGGTDFLTGAITFCSMLPMRSIPFKVICLLGMNDGSYPRPGRRRSFDLMAAEPQRGDRSRRYDDRYLFLETILSARETLLISFIGQSIRDTSRKPPSTLVSELMDYIAQGYILTHDGSTGDIINHLTTHHRLQPFHPYYFYNETDSGTNDLFSYSMENCHGAAALTTGQQQKRTPVISAPLGPPPDIYKQMAIHELISFFTHPTRYFLLKRVGIAPFEKAQIQNTSEPFTVHGLARYELENDILACLMSGHDCNDLFLIKKATGILPHGKMGEIFFTQTVTKVKSFKRNLDKLFSQNRLDHQEVTLAVQDFTISGRLENLTPTGMVQYRYAAIKSKDVIRGWINHLIYNSIRCDGESDSRRNTYLVGSDKIYCYEPISASHAYLEQLLCLYWEGLSKPLHFFPEASYCFMQEIYNGKSRREALRKARNKWEGDTFTGRAEKNDPYNSLCYKNISLSESDFMDQAEKIFLPVFKHMNRFTG